MKMKSRYYLIIILTVALLFTEKFVEKEDIPAVNTPQKVLTATPPKMNHVEILHASFGNVDEDANLDGLLVFIKPADEERNLVKTEGTITMELYRVFKEEDGWDTYGTLKVNGDPYVGAANITHAAYREIGSEEGFLMGARVDGWVDDGLLFPGDTVAIFVNFTTLDGTTYRTQQDVILRAMPPINTQLGEPFEQLPMF